MKKSSSNKTKNIKTLEGVVHFIGIGGIGISSLARWYKTQNWSVSGSDAIKSSVTDDLKRDGIRVKIGHKKTNIPKDAQLVIHTVAIPTDNEELTEARNRGIRVITYPQALGEFTGMYKTIAISGCHGKSTTTAMMAKILIEAKLDPTVVVGTKVEGSNFRAGKGKYLVIEADEYRGAFWNYLPYAAIINNIELDHLDFYKDIDTIKNSFSRFTENVSNNGFIVANGDDKDVDDVIKKVTNVKKIISFGKSDGVIISKIKKVIKIPGHHNVLNALAAYKVARELKIKEDVILKAIGKFKGVWRRSEYKGKTKEGWKVFDDYAHHPTAVKVTLDGFKEKYPKDYLVAVFQPHQMLRFTSLYEDFKICFDSANKALLFDVYNPTGRDEKKSKVNAKTLVKDLNVIAKQNRQPQKTAYATKEDFKKTINSVIKESGKKNGIIVIMGAGDINDITPKILVK